MGDDSVIECVYENGIVSAHTSLTTRGEGNNGANRARVVCLGDLKLFFQQLFCIGSEHHHTKTINDGKWSNLLSS